MHNKNKTSCNINVKQKNFDFCNISVTLQTLNTFNNVLLYSEKNKFLIKK